MRRLILALGLGATLSAPACAQMATLTPEHIGQIFCLSRLGNDMAPVEGILAPELAAAIAGALAESEALQRRYPDEKPPLGDGVPWQSYPDYADRCTPRSASVNGDESRVPIAYGFSDAPDADFTDHLVLRRTDPPHPEAERPWRIADVAYATGGGLGELLVSAAAAE